MGGVYFNREPDTPSDWHIYIYADASADPYIDRNSATPGLIGCLACSGRAWRE